MVNLLQPRGRAGPVGTEQRQGGIMRYAGGVLLALAVTAIPCGAVVVGVAFAPAVSLALHGRALRGPGPLPATHRRGDRSSAPWNLRMSCPLDARTSQTHDRRKAVRDLICRFSVLSSLQHALVSAAWAEADYNTMRAAKKNYAPRLTKGDLFPHAAPCHRPCSLWRLTSHQV